MTLPIDNASAHMQHVQHAQRPRFDGTVNIPTILMLFAMLAGALASGLGLYTTLNDRITSNTGDIRLLKIQQADARAADGQSRTDVHDQMHDISAKLDKLLWDRGDQAKRP